MFEPDSTVSEWEETTVMDTPPRDYPNQGSVTIRLQQTQNTSMQIKLSQHGAQALHQQLGEYLTTKNKPQSDT